MRRLGQEGPRCGRGVLTVSRLTFILVLTAVLCLAAVLRFYRLGAQSFWNDEGNSARIAERSLGLILEGAAGDIHPPGYYLLLHVWRALFGESEWALRSLSAWAGIVLVAVTGLLGRYLFGRTTGLMAAMFSALSPLSVYYSQEARMYALLATLTAISAYLTFSVVAASHRPVDREDGSSRELSTGTLCIYALINGLGLYTHYTFALVLVAHNTLYATSWLARLVRGRTWKRGVGWWIGAQLTTALIYLPWIPTAWRAIGWSSAGGGYDLGTALLGVTRALVAGITLPLSGAKVAMGGGLGLLLIGLCLWRREDSLAVGRWSARWSVAGLLIYLVVPLGLFLGLDLYKPAWLKFLVILLPAFHVLSARGASTLGAAVSQIWARFGHRAWGVRVVVCGLVVAMVGLVVYPSLRNLYFDPAYARDDYRQLAADIQQMWRTGDGVVLNAPNQWEVFTYYHPDRHVYPTPYRPTPDAISAFAEPLIDEHSRLFVVYWGDAESDPHKHLELWLAGHAYKADDRWYGDVRLATYGVAALPGSPDRATNVLFGDRLRLAGFTVTGDAFSAGEIVPVTLFWEALDTLPYSYKVTVQMLDREGRLVGQMDTVPLDGLAPTVSWEPGETLTDRYGVWIPEGTANGPYSLLVAVYHAVDGQRLPVTSAGLPLGDTFGLGEIRVEPSG